MITNKKILMCGMVFLSMYSFVEGRDLSTFEHIKGSPYTARILAGTALVSTVWAVKEWYHRSSQKEKLEKKILQEKMHAFEEVEKLTVELSQLKEDENYSLEEALFLENFEEKYTHEIATFQKGSLTDTDLHTLLTAITTRLKKEAISLELLEEGVQKELTDFQERTQRLEGKVQLWKTKQWPYLSAKGQALVERAHVCVDFLQKLKELLAKQKEYICLESLVTADYTKHYTFELYNADTLGLKERDPKVHDRIRSLFKQEKFPYVAYERKLEEESFKLEALLMACQNLEKPTATQRQLIESSWQLCTALKRVRDFVRSTKEYKEQEFSVEWKALCQQVEDIEKKIAKNETVFQAKLEDLQQQCQTLTNFMKDAQRVHVRLQDTCDELYDKLHSLKNDVQRLSVHYWARYRI